MKYLRRSYCVTREIRDVLLNVSHQVVPTSAGEALAKEFGIPFMETSAVESVNVDEAFDLLSQNVFDKLESMGVVSRRNSGTYNNNSNGSSPSPTQSRSNNTVHLSDNKQPMMNSTQCC